MLDNKKAKIENRIILFLVIFLFLIGTASAAHQIFFRKIEIKIEGVEWVEEFKINIVDIELKNEPCFLIIKPDNSEIREGVLAFDKKNITMGNCTNSQFLVPLRVKSNKEKNNLFFIPQFRARVIGGENLRNKGGEDLRLRADFSLYLWTTADKCPIERGRIQGDNFVLCNIGITSSNVMIFNITEKRKNTLVKEIKELTDKKDYILVLKIAPDLKIIKNISSFSIAIENIVPELIITN